MLFVLLSILVHTAHAADGNEALKQPPMPTLTKVDGQPFEALWPNGDRAQVQINRNDPIIVPVTFEMTENLCNNSAPKSLVGNFAFKTDRLRWIWTQNADPKKVGQVLMVGDSFPLLLPVPINNTTRFKDPVIAAGLPPDELTIDGTDWIPALANTGAPQPFTIPTWMSEQMIPNPETGISENRITASVSGVHLQPKGSDPKVWVIDHVDSGAESSSHGLSLFLGDVSDWVFNVNGTDCQISFKPNETQAKAMISKYQAALPDQWTVYKWGEDSLGKQTEILEGVLRYAK